MRENREILVWPEGDTSRAASGRLRPQSDAWGEEVGRAHSTCEAAEQGRRGCGGGGGKGPGQGKHGASETRAGHSAGHPCSMSWPCTHSRKPGQGCLLRQAVAVVRQPPEARAQCVSSARWDLCGGRRVTHWANRRPYRDRGVRRRATMVLVDTQSVDGRIAEYPPP